MRIAGFKIPHWEIDSNQHIVSGKTYNPCSFATYATHDFPPICNDWNEWYSHVKAGREALQDVALSGQELRDKLRVAKDCSRVLGWLGEYAGLSLEQSLVPWGQGIKEALFAALLQCRSAYVAMMWTELFDVPERLNTPGTVGGTNWRPRMPFTAAEAASMPQSKWLARLSAESAR